MSVREEFGAWITRLRKDEEGEQSMWVTWQAAYAAGQESMRAKLDEQWNDGFDKGKAAGRKAGLEEAAGNDLRMGQGWVSASPGQRSSCP
jgi:hypothetical protein